MCNCRRWLFQLWACSVLHTIYMYYKNTLLRLFYKAILLKTFNSLKNLKNSAIKFSFLKPKALHSTTIYLTKRVFFSTSKYFLKLNCPVKSKWWACGHWTGYKKKSIEFLIDLEERIGEILICRWLINNLNQSSKLST